MQTTNNLIKLSPMLRRPTVEFESKPVVVIPGDLWWYSPECLAIFTEILGDIRQNVWRHSPKCLRTFPGMFEDIPRNVWRYSLECLATLPECLRRLPEMFGDIPRNKTFHLFPAFRSPFLYSWFYSSSSSSSSSNLYL